jgi:transcription elongation factor GreA
MADEPIYLTEAGARQLRQELDELVNEGRPALADTLREASAMGDLTENADYLDAKERQAFLEGRIQQIEHLLRNATIVPSDHTSETIRVGSRVTIVEEGRPPEDYIIVGAAEANPTEGKISHESPIGRALLGHRAGETVTVAAPAGGLRFKIEAVA